MKPVITLVERDSRMLPSPNMATATDRVYFVREKGRYEIEIAVVDGELQLRSSGRQLVVRPNVSNSITVTTDGR